MKPLRHVPVLAALAAFLVLPAAACRPPAVDHISQSSECGGDDAAAGAGGAAGASEGGAGGDVGGMAGGEGGATGPDVGGAAGAVAEGGAGGTAGADVGGMGGDAGAAGADLGGSAGGGAAGAEGGASAAAGSSGGGGSAGATGGAGGGGASGAGGTPGCGVSSAGGARGIETLTTWRAYSMIEVAPCALFATTSSTTLGNVSVSTDDGHTWAPHPGLTSLTASAGRLNALGEVLVGTRAPTAKVWVCTLTGCTAPPSYPSVSTSDDITAISEDRGGVVWATSQNHNNVVARSVDHGHTWTGVATPGQFAVNGKVWTVEVDADYGVLLGGEIGTVMQSSDNGATWSPWGLPRPPYHGNLWSLAQSPTTGTLFAAVPDPQATPNGSAQYHRLTDGAGVWHGISGMANNWTDLSGFVFQADGSTLAGGNQSGLGVIWKSTAASDGATWTRVGPTGLAGAVRLHIGRSSGCLYFTDASGGLKRSCAGF